MKPRADASAATLRREVAPRQDQLPPAALALARLIGEAVGERLWREALAADQSEAIAQDAPQLSKPERIAEPCSQGCTRSTLIAGEAARLQATAGHLWAREKRHKALAIPGQPSDESVGCQPKAR
jgi:hypothetical protein